MMALGFTATKEHFIMLIKKSFLIALLCQIVFNQHCYVTTVGKLKISEQNCFKEHLDSYAYVQCKNNLFLIIVNNIS